MSFPQIKSNAGTPVVIYTTCAGGRYPIHGSYHAGDNEWIATAWSFEGEHFQGRTSGLDITEAVANGALSVQAQG